ncbi:MAG: histidinol-phosphate transaminase [Kiritimatiellia bacterium]
MKKSLIRRNIRLMAGYTPGEQMAGRDLVKLNTNENPYPPSPKAARSLRALDPARLRLYPDPVCSQIRTKLAALHGVEPEQIFVGNGSDEVLRLITLAFVENNGALGMFSPSYSLYDVLADSIGVPMKKVPLGADFGWRMPASFRASVFFITSPNNPTGVAYPAREVRRFCASFKGLVVIDEAYVDFCDWNHMELANAFPNVLVLRTLSKSFGLAGIRLGYAVGPRPLIDTLLKLKDSYNVNVLTQTAALAALDDMPYMRRQVGRILKSRVRLVRELERLGFVITPSQANFVWVRPTRVAAKVLFEALRQRRILVRYNPKDWHPGYIRITVGTDAEITKLLGAIRAIQK